MYAHSIADHRLASSGKEHLNTRTSLQHVGQTCSDLPINCTQFHWRRPESEELLLSLRGSTSTGSRHQTDFAAYRVPPFAAHVGAAEPGDNHTPKRRPRLKGFYFCMFIECGKVFDLQSRLTKHYKDVHHPEIDRRFACDNCEKRFTAQSHLDRHTTIHTRADESKQEGRAIKRRCMEIAFQNVSERASLKQPDLRIEALLYHMRQTSPQLLSRIKRIHLLLAASGLDVVGKAYTQAQLSASIKIYSSLPLTHISTRNTGRARPFSELIGVVHRGVVVIAHKSLAPVVSSNFNPHSHIKFRSLDVTKQYWKFLTDINNYAATARPGPAVEGYRVIMLAQNALQSVAFCLRFWPVFILSAPSSHLTIYVAITKWRRGLRYVGRKIAQASGETDTEDTATFVAILQAMYLDIQRQWMSAEPQRLIDLSTGPPDQLETDMRRLVPFSATPLLQVAGPPSLRDLHNPALKLLHVLEPLVIHLWLFTSLLSFDARF